ncbi:MAG TPA: WG repeat-containing protein [Saprospiraceae bacterium]|nr:WG repeat-containing protein [Saprospiraceae bacterium]
MEKNPKPSMSLVKEVLNIEARIDMIQLHRAYEIITRLNSRKSQIMESYDWSDQQFEVNGRFGLMDCFGEILIPAEYDETWFRTDFFVTRNKPIACRKEGKWGMVLPDGKGTNVTDFLYDNIFLDQYYTLWSFIIVILNGKFGLLDASGHHLSPTDIDEIYHPVNDMGKVRKGNKYGFVYYNGDYIEPVYEEIAFSGNNSKYTVKLNGIWGFVDKEKGFIASDTVNKITGCNFYGSII